MKVQIKHYGKIKNGKKEYYNTDLYDQQMIALEGKEFVEIIKELHEKPTLSQYGYYRGGILPFCHQSEYFKHFDTKDDIHSLFFAKKYLSYTKLVALPNEQYEEKDTRSLADLDKSEMSEFIDRVIAWCYENNIHVPSSEEFYNKYYQR